MTRENELPKIEFTKKQLLTLESFFKLYEPKLLSEDMINVLQKVEEAAKAFTPINTLVISKNHHTANVYVDDFIRRYTGLGMTITKNKRHSRLEMIVKFDDHINKPDEIFTIIPLSQNHSLEGFRLEYPLSSNPYLINFNSFRDNETEDVALAINILNDIKRRNDRDW